MYVQRKRMAEGDEKAAMDDINYNWMSDEEDGEGENKDCWVVRSPTFRSDALNHLLKTLQERVDRKEMESSSKSKHPKFRRIIGTPSSRPAPASSPAWAVRPPREEPEPIRERSRSRSRSRERTPVNFSEDEGDYSVDTEIQSVPAQRKAKKRVQLGREKTTTKKRGRGRRNCSTVDDTHTV